MDEDEEVAWIDMRAAGLRVVSAKGDFREYFERLRGVAQELGVVKGDAHLREYTLRYKGNSRRRGLLLFALLVIRERKVVSVIFGSTRQGLLRSLNRRLTQQGWRRLFFVEMAPLSRRAPHLGGARHTPI